MRQNYGSLIGGVVIIIIALNMSEPEVEEIDTSGLAHTKESSTGNQGGSSGGGGGGSESDSNTTVSNQPTEPEIITNVKMCNKIQYERFCLENEIQDSNYAILYWEVVDGVGCCNTFGCDYNKFAQACLEPEFNLYHLRLDGELYTPDGIEYTCTHTQPYNFYEWYNVTVNETHTVSIIQKDCVDVVDIKTIEFTLTENNGTYIMRYAVV